MSDRAESSAETPRVVRLSDALEAIEGVKKQKLGEVNVSEPTNEVLKDAAEEMTTEIEEAASRAE